MGNRTQWKRPTNDGRREWPSKYFCVQVEFQLEFSSSSESADEASVRQTLCLRRVQQIEKFTNKSIAA